MPLFRSTKRISKLKISPTPSVKAYTQPGVSVHLPLELVQEILLCTTRVHPSKMVDLVCLSKWAQQMIEPIMYNVVTLIWPSTVKKFLYATERKPASTFENVKTLIIAKLAELAGDSILQVIHHCSRVENIACWLAHTDHLANFYSLHPRRVSILMGPYACFALSASQTAFFAGVTHLTCLDSSMIANQWRWTKISFLPYLTHLELPIQKSDITFAPTWSSTPQQLVVTGVIESLFGCFPRLQVLLLQLSDRYEPGVEDGLRMTGDPRCVVMAKRGVKVMKDEWEAQSRDGNDRWAEADAIVAFQRERAKESWGVEVEGVVRS